MLEAIKYSATGAKIGTVTLNEEIFNVSSLNDSAVLYEVINMYLANQRQGTASTKTRAEVQGTTAKMYRQKGTGNARAGSRRSPIRVGGGVAFGPKPKDWYKSIPKKKKRLALKIALTEKAKEGKIVVIEDLKFEKASTKQANELLNKLFPEKGRKLIVIDGSDKNVIKSFTNITGAATDRADSIYAYEVLKSSYVLLTEKALQTIEEVFGK
ncbi:MAG: 50S ribosomal protein L4 [Candidatus Cloacimonas sp.]|jgi:large subunit ribosomal protein L4|nr:50S ribosomal protein L4 [Candidatus Cloacimonadota bacterium]